MDTIITGDKMSEFDDYEIKLLNMTEEEMNEIANGEE